MTPNENKDASRGSECYPNEEIRGGSFWLAATLRMEHRLIHGEECCYGNSGYSFGDGYDFYHCACGTWREAHQTNGDAMLSHYNHVLASPPNEKAHRSDEAPPR